MTDEKKAFIEYPWGPEHDRKVFEFDRDDILDNAVRLFDHGDAGASGSTDMERAAWRAATKRGVRKLMNEYKGLKVKLVSEDDASNPVQDWLYDNANLVQNAVRDAAEGVLNNSPHLIRDAVNDAVSFWFTQNGDSVRSAIRSASLQAARERG